MSDVKKYNVSLSKIIEEFQLEEVSVPSTLDSILIDENDVTRPGLQLMGFYEYFNNERIQVIGNMEHAYLNELSSAERHEKLETLFKHNIPALIVTRGLPIFDEMRELAKKYEIALLRTKDTTASFISGLITFLNTQLAPRITRHGVLIEIYGEGVLIMGESGVGKSETAIELVKRGHRLVADDAVEIKRISNSTLIGSSPDNIRHFLELRGIGIINARRLFGIGAVKMSQHIDLIVELEQWNAEKIYDRMGVDTEYTNILGIDVPSVTIPVRPGRNLAVILEVAAMNNRQKEMGYNAAHELLHKLGLEMEQNSTYKHIDDIDDM
jgi:HPr kinase/phosphorylase